MIVRLFPTVNSTGMQLLASPCPLTILSPPATFAVRIANPYPGLSLSPFLSPCPFRCRRIEVMAPLEGVELLGPRLDAQALCQVAPSLPLRRTVSFRDAIGRLSGHLPETEDHVGVSGLFNIAQHRRDLCIADLEACGKACLEPRRIGLRLKRGWTRRDR